MAGEAMSAFVRFFVKDEASAQAKQVEKKVEEAAESMDEAAQAGERMTGGLMAVKNGAATCVKGVAALGAGLTAAAASIWGLSAATDETQEDLGKLETAFTSVGHSSETAKSVLNDFTGLLGGENFDQAVEASNHLAELTSSTEELASWGDIAAGVYAKFGDSLPLEGLTEAANHTAKLGEVQGPLADSLEWAGYSTEEFNKQLAACSSEEERASLITSTLSDIYSEAGASYRETNADLVASREAQANWNATLAEAGAVVRPFVTSFQKLATDGLQFAMPYLQRFGEWFTGKLPEIKEKAASAFGYIKDNVIPPLKEAFAVLKDDVLPKVQTAFTWFKDNLPMIAAGAAGLYAAFMAYQAMTAIVGVIGAVKGAITAWKIATEGMTLAQKLLNLTMMANPFVLIGTLIAGLIAWFIVAYNTSDEFRAKVDAAFAKIKEAVSSAIASVKETVAGMVSSLSSAFSSAYEKASSIFGKIKSTISDAINGARDAVKTAIDAIKGFFNFSFSWPNLPLPHFSISPSGWKIGDLLEGVIPSLGISWYAKGAIFNAATLLPAAGGFAGVGEAGPEAVAPISVLMDYVRKAVSEANAGGGYVVNINVTTGETNETKLAKLIAREEKRQAYALGAI